MMMMLSTGNTGLFALSYLKRSSPHFTSTSSFLSHDNINDTKAALTSADFGQPVPAGQPREGEIRPSRTLV
jgi:hypothetical protein